MTATHTPGPWKANYHNVFAGEALVCTSVWKRNDPKSVAQANANAAIIAAAPELLGALIRISHLCHSEATKPDGSPLTVEYLQAEIQGIARAAIARA